MSVLFKKLFSEEASKTIYAVSNFQRFNETLLLKVQAVLLHLRALDVELQSRKEICGIIIFSLPISLIVFAGYFLFFWVFKPIKGAAALLTMLAVVYGKIYFLDKNYEVTSFQDFLSLMPELTTMYFYVFIALNPLMFFEEVRNFIIDLLDFFSFGTVTKITFFYVRSLRQHSAKLSQAKLYLPAPIINHLYTSRISFNENSGSEALIDKFSQLGTEDEHTEELIESEIQKYWQNVTLNKTSP